MILDIMEFATEIRFIYVLLSLNLPSGLLKYGVVIAHGLRQIRKESDAALAQPRLAPPGLGAEFRADTKAW